MFTWHVQPVKQYIADLEPALNDNYARMESTITTILSQLSKLDGSTHNFTEIKYSREATSHLQHAIQTLTETADTLRSYINYIME